MSNHHVCTAHVLVDGGEPEPCDRPASVRIVKADGTTRALACRLGSQRLYTGETLAPIDPPAEGATVKPVRLAEATYNLGKPTGHPAEANAPREAPTPAQTAPVFAPTPTPVGDLASAVAVLVRHCDTLRGRRRRDFSDALVTIVREATR